MIVKNPSVSLETNTDYLNAVVYEEGVIDYITMDEGLVKNESGEYRYHYYLQDHLGNTRAVFKNDGGNVATLIQANSYYPFGLEMPELSYVSGSGETKYKYNGKEMQDAFSLNWIDYGARFYDPQIGRWHTADKLAEKYYGLSPYNFVANNPLRYIDPDGKKIVDAQGRAAVTVGKNGNIEFTKYATADIKTVVGAMIQSKIGVEVSMDLINAQHNISISLNREEGATYYNPGTKEYSKEKQDGSVLLLGESRTVSTNDRKDFGKVDIIINEGSIMKAQEKGLVVTYANGEKVDLSSKTISEIIGATAVHEGTHGTDKKSSKALGASEAEKKPRENELRHYKETEKK